MEDLLLAILVGLALAAVRMRDLLGATAVLGAYSLMMAILWATMNALDVAFTEAAVGAGISTVLLLAAIDRVGRKERGAGSGPVLKPMLQSMAVRNEYFREKGDRPRRASQIGALALCIAMGGILVYGMQDMPSVGDANSPANSNEGVARRYIEKSPHRPDAGTLGEVGAANIVTSVLGDYRGFDTMGETVVIFTAALCVLLLLREGRPVVAARRERETAEGGRDGDG